MIMVDTTLCTLSFVSASLHASCTQAWHSTLCSGLGFDASQTARRCKQRQARTCLPSETPLAMPTRTARPLNRTVEGSTCNVVGLAGHVDEGEHAQKMWGAAASAITSKTAESFAVYF